MVREQEIELWYRVARRVIGRRVPTGEVEDLVQEAVLIAWEEWRRREVSLALVAAVARRVVWSFYTGKAIQDRSYGYAHRLGGGRSYVVLPADLPARPDDAAAAAFLAVEDREVLQRVLSRVSRTSWDLLRRWLRGGLPPRDRMRVCRLFKALRAAA